MEKMKLSIFDGCLYGIFENGVILSMICSKEESVRFFLTMAS